MMPKANADQIRIASLEESVFGTAADGANYATERIVNETLAQTSGTTRSREITGSRRVSQFYRLELATAGTIAAEWSYGTFDKWIEGAMFADGSGFTSAATLATSAAVGFTQATGAMALTNIGASGVTAGDWIKVTGASNAANNGYKKVLSVTADELIVAGFVPLADESGSGVTVTRGSQITDGSKMRSFTIEREYTDLTNEIVQYLGSIFESWTGTVENRQLVSTSFGVRGKSEADVTSSAGDGYDARTTTEAFNSVENIVGTMLGTPAINTTYDDVMTRFTWTCTNNLRDRPGFGQLGPDSYGSGKFEASGGLSFYYETKDEVTKFLDFTSSAAAIAFEDAAGNAYIVDFPSVKYSSANRNTPGENSDIIAQLEWVAFEDPDESIMCRVVRFPAA
jgi:hypothetical protein